MESDGSFARTRAQYAAPPSNMPLTLDEGFSESASQDETDQMTLGASALGFHEWVMAQNEETRAEIAYGVLKTLRTSNIAAVVDRLTPLLHMDPIKKLPPEITSEIFAHLSAPTLLNAALASHRWRGRILDSRLWKTLYLGQGWGVDADAIREFEHHHTHVVRQEFRNAKPHTRSSDAEGGLRNHKKRATSGWHDCNGRRIKQETKDDMPMWGEQHGQIEADTDAHGNGMDHEMSDAPAAEPYLASPSRRNKRHSQDSGDEMSISSTVAHVSGLDETIPEMQLDPPLKPTLLAQEKSGDDQFGSINWTYLYKQRRRLEENWTKGRFTNFQLPHPQYPQEAHTECVYTIQFYGKWLVSGSRDKTLRVWDLDTRRLRGKPLVGHTQSVLCLQFDPRPEEDVIISGSSDTSIIVWRFSTGEKINEIPQAHRESVLNLRFDERYLVTCSKDKLIKVWNRRELVPTDPNYPKIHPKSEAKMPSHIVDVSSMTPSQLEAKIANRQIKTLLPYTLLMVLDGHGAAVNAIQIDNDQIVSASGDRNIKIWNVQTGKCLRTLPGHLKGIACVQFDSKRIVSGSSDNTVRIYDPVSGAQVAVLAGHQNLVRTVQAGFGDVPGDDSDLVGLARLAEEEHAIKTRMRKGRDEPAHLVRRVTRHQRSGSGGGSELRAYGASLPPNGGGSRWGRIVSGSYDETIIIWKKDPSSGKWIQTQTLRQEAAVRASALAEQRALQNTALAAPLVNGNAGLGAVALAGASHMPIPSASQIVQSTMGASMSGLQTGMQTGMQNVMHLSRNLQPHLQSHTFHQAATVAAAMMGPGAQQAMQQLTAHAQNVMQNAVHQASQQQQQQQQQQAQAQAQLQQLQSGAPGGNSNPPAHAQGQAPAPAPPPVPNATTPALPPPPPGAQAQQAHQAQQQQAQSVSRVFKLQFDARRIVCCSQDSRIIGWDFSNGDEEIIEASRFFVGP